MTPDQREDETTIVRLGGRLGPEYVLSGPDGRWRPGVFATLATAESASRLPDTVLARLQRRADARRRGGSITAADLVDLTEAEAQEPRERHQRPRTARRPRDTREGHGAA